MDKGIIFSIIIAAAVSITAAMFWDKIVDTPKMENLDVDKTDGDKVPPNDETVKSVYKPSSQIIQYPNENNKPKRTAKPPRQPKPTVTDPVRGDNTENTSDTNFSNVNTSSDKTHIVRKGDTLIKISQKYYQTQKYWTYLQEYNKLPNDRLDIGQKLKIPVTPPQN